ncbi:MAG: pantetheine-phosphate adenylyltransferase [Chloroflexi bacterium]|nr:pantetheine-phosphate adenylyltransferase [Chloroflexota bacterium]
MSVSIYPGSFDPITYGHLDIVERAARVFDRVIVAVLRNPRKAALFDEADRVEIIRRAIEEELPPEVARRVSIVRFDGLTVEAARQHGAEFVVRGLRAMSDFETELQMAHFNRKLAPGIDTVFFMTALEHAYLSSSLVKEIARFGGDVGGMVPAAVAERLRSVAAEWSGDPAVG